MNPFKPTGPILSFTGANSAPTSVQAVSLDNSQHMQVVLTNTDAVNDCIVGYGQTDAMAKVNAAAGASTNQCYYLLARSQVIIEVVSGSYFSGITPGTSVTAVIKVQAGDGA